MTQLRSIDETISVSPQIAPEDMASLADAGFTFVVNNRPDGEESGQPAGDAIAAAARAAGLGYAAIPVTMAGFSATQVEAMADALDAAPGPLLAFCRSGTRSTHLWALAQASKGADPADLTARAAAAGYDIGGIRPVLDALSGRG